MKKTRGGPILVRTMQEAGTLGEGLETSSKDAPYTERLAGSKSSKETKLKRSGC